LKYPSISYQHKSARSPSPHPVSSQNSFLKQQIEIMLLEGNYRHPYSLSLVEVNQANISLVVLEMNFEKKLGEEREI